MSNAKNDASQRVVIRETIFIAACIGVASLIVEAGFLILGKWNVNVLLGNLAGAAVTVANFWLMARAAVKALNTKDTGKIKANAMIRLFAVGLICGACVGFLKLDPIATLFPLVVPGLAMKLRPMFLKDKTNSEGGNVLD